MSKVQLKDISTNNKIYPITNAQYVEGFDDKFSELNKQDEDDIKQLKERVDELGVYDDTEIKNRLNNTYTKEESDNLLYKKKMVKII